MFAIVVMIYLLLIRIKSHTKLLIYSTIQSKKPDYRQFTPSGFAALLKSPTFKGVQYKRWRTRAVYWFQIMYCYDATKGKPEGDLNPIQQEAFQNMDTLFKATLLSVLDDSIVDSYMSFDSGKRHVGCDQGHVWALGRWQRDVRHGGIL